MKFNTKYSYSKVPGFTFQRPSMVQPQFGYECDINNIVAGCVSTIDKTRTLTFVDDTTVTDLQDAMNLLSKANQEFSELPSNIRERFGNDPRLLLAFLGDEKNYEEAVKLGLVNNRPVSSEAATQTVETVTQSD